METDTRQMALSWFGGGFAGEVARLIVSDYLDDEVGVDEAISMMINDMMLSGEGIKSECS